MKEIYGVIFGAMLAMTACINADKYIKNAIRLLIVSRYD